MMLCIELPQLVSHTARGPNTTSTIVAKATVTTAGAWKEEPEPVSKVIGALMCLRLGRSRLSESIEAAHAQKGDKVWKIRQAYERPWSPAREGSSAGSQLFCVTLGACQAGGSFINARRELLREGADYADGFFERACRPSARKEKQGRLTVRLGHE